MGDNSDGHCISADDEMAELLAAGYAPFSVTTAKFGDNPVNADSTSTSEWVELPLSAPTTRLTCRKENSAAVEEELQCAGSTAEWVERYSFSETDVELVPVKELQNSAIIL